MANRKITDMTALTAPASTDVLPIVDVSETTAADKNKKITVAELFKGIPDGTAAAPSIAFESDDGNGIYLAGTDTVAISTGGTQRLSVNASGVVTIAGDLQVEGSTTTIESTTLTVDDKNIELGSVDTPTDTTADGGGITLKGATDKTINWVNSTDAWTSSERFDFPAGTAAAPSVILNGDVNSGIYQPGADQVAISTAGSARLYIAADGDIGVGTTSPEALLEVQGADNAIGSNGTILVKANSAGADDGGQITLGSANGRHVAVAGRSEGSSGTAGYLQLGVRGSSGDIVERLRIDSSGRVGIGTSTPSSYDGGGRTLVLAESTNSGITIRGGTSGQGAIYFADGTTGNEAYRGRIEYSHSTDSLNLGTAGTGSLVAIDSSGRLGVGVTSPSTLLHTNATSADNELRVATTTSGNPIVSFHANGAGAHEIGFDRTDLALYFKTVGSSERMRIDSSGRLGVGTSSPSYLLHVSGANAEIGLTDTNVTNATWRLLAQTGNSTKLFRIYDSSNAADRLVINASGYVGIGTTDPQRALVVSDAGAEGFEFYPGSSDTGNTLNHYDRGSSSFIDITTNADQHIFGRADGEKIRIDGSGRLLVGTSSSRSFNTHQGAIQIDGDTFSQSTLAIVSNSNTADGAYIFFVKQRSGSSGGNTVVQNNDIIGEFRFNSGDGSDCESLSGQIQCRVDGTPGSNDVPGRLVFSTTPDGSNGPTERFRIASTGAFGLSGANYGSSGQVLTSNGSGSAPSWQAAGGGSANYNQAIKTNTFTTTTTSYIDVPGLSTTISPSSTSARILVTISLSSGSNVRDAHYRLRRNSTDLAVGDSDGNREQCTFQGGCNHDAGGRVMTNNNSFTYIDHPNTTSNTTYKVRMSATTSANSYVNRSHDDNNNTSDNQGHRTASIITVMEIK